MGGGNWGIGEVGNWEVASKISTQEFYISHSLLPTPNFYLAGALRGVLCPKPKPFRPVQPIMM